MFDALLDGETVKPKVAVNGGETVSLAAKQQVETDAVAEDIPLQILYADADVLVAASGDTIKRTLSLNLGNASASKERVQMKTMARSSLMADSAAYEPPPISAGDITVRASVSVTYELESP